MSTIPIGRRRLLRPSRFAPAGAALSVLFVAFVAASAAPAPPSFTALGDLDGGEFFSAASAISADGAVVVGTSYVEPSDRDTCFGGPFRGFRWTESTGMVSVSDLVPGEVCGCSAISADGSTLACVFSTWIDTVHYVLHGPRLEVVEVVPQPRNGSLDSISSISADGQVFTGTMFTASQIARAVADVLSADYGLDLSGWTLTGAMISGDGRSLAGRATNPRGDTEAWLAHLGPVGDLNHDGHVDGADLGMMLASWGTAAIDPDLDYDGVVDGADLGILLAGWSV